jgi:hypothetical protein
MGLSFTVTAGPRQRSHSQVQVPLDSWPHFTVSDSRLPQPGWPGPRIYIPHEQGGLVIPPGTGFFFRRLLRLSGVRWKYSTPPPHGDNLEQPVSDKLRLYKYLKPGYVEGDNRKICNKNCDKAFTDVEIR